MITNDPDIPAALGDKTTPVSYTFTAVAGEDWHPSFDFGRDNTGRIGDLVWYDPADPGVRNAGEPGLDDVTLSLYQDNNNDNKLDGGDTFLAATTTDANGQYWFVGLADGNYVVAVNAATLPGYTQTYDNIVPLDGVGEAGISGGNTVDTVDFGYKSTTGTASLYSIGGHVYNDTSGDGNYQGGEPGFAGVDVTVVCNFGTFVVQSVGATGLWGVNGIPAGSTCSVLDADENDLPRTDYVAVETPATPITVITNMIDLDFGYRQTPGIIRGTVCVGSGDGLCNAASPVSPPCRSR